MITKNRNLLHFFLKYILVLSLRILNKQGIDMHTIIVLLLGLSYLNFVDSAHKGKGYYSYSLDHHKFNSLYPQAHAPDPEKIIKLYLSTLEKKMKKLIIFYTIKFIRFYASRLILGIKNQRYQHQLHYQHIIAILNHLLMCLGPL